MKQMHSLLSRVCLVFVFAMATLCASAQVTVDVKGQTVRQVLQTVEKTSGYSVFFADNLADLNKKVTIKAKNEKMETFLDRLLKNTRLSYAIEGNKQVVISEKAAPAESSKKESVKQTKRISGVITDATGETLSGVSIVALGLGVGTTSDGAGKYALDVPEGVTVQFSYIGFEDHKTKVGDSSIYNIVMKEKNFALNEVVVIGYGTMKRKDITTAVSVVSTEDLDQRPIMSAAQALEGKAAGVQVTQPSGSPGAGVSVRVRGATSVLASNEPLYVVDGIPTDNISDLSANDILSMQVLKDASSAAIYGARAANGVVLITTKRGKEGMSKVTFNAYAGISKLGRKIDALNTEQYKELMQELSLVTTAVPTIPESENRYTDWTDTFFKTGVSQNYQLALQNGTEKLKYYISGGYSDEKGIVEKSHYQRYNFRANIDGKQSDWLDLLANVSYSNTKGNWVGESRSAMRGGSILSVINTPPYMQEWNPDVPGQYDEESYGSRILNPFAANAADNCTRTDLFKGSIGAVIHLAKGLALKSTFDVDLYNEHWNYYLDPTSTSDGRASKGRTEESWARNFEWLWENILTYDFSVQNHNFSLMGGATQEHAQYNSSSLAGFDMTMSYPELVGISAANQIDKDGVNSSAAAWSLASFLGRIAYNYDSRYLLTANFRADGSSRFAEGHRWGFFPSVSAGWRLSSEEFMEGSKSWLDDFKIRAGWGMNGNQGGIGNYSYLAHMSASRVAPTEENLYPGMAITAYSAANKELTWEKTEQLNAGIDLSLFGERVIFSADVYYKHTTDLLLTISLPDNVNLPGGITRNDGEMVNKGLEFNLSTHNLKGAFTWNTDFNISLNRNKLTKLGLNKVYYYASIYENREAAIILKEGLPLGSFFGYISEGVDPETGDIVYSDLNGNGTLDPNDRTVIGCAQPDFIYGMTNTFGYKGISLSVFIQGSQGNDIFNASRIDMEEMLDFRNQSTAVLDRWKRPGMVTDIPRVGNSANIHNSTRFVEDGSYLRFKTVTLSYDVDRSWLKKVRLSRLQAYATAQNLLTLTRYRGYDPEVNAYGSSSVQLGIDYGTYPQSKSVIFGLNVEF